MFEKNKVGHGFSAKMTIIPKMAIYIRMQRTIEILFLYIFLQSYLGDAIQIKFCNLGLDYI